MDAMGEDASIEKIHTSTMAYIEHPFPEFWVSQNYCQPYCYKLMKCMCFSK